MTPDKLPSLNEIEHRVRMTTSSNHECELILMQRLVDIYLGWFNLFSSFTLTEDNEVQYAWLLLITQGFHSMRCALWHMQIGYYGQAMSLLRIATEDWFICEDCQRNERTLKAILHDETLKLNYSEMAERAGAKDIVYKRDYHYLSRFTHPSRLGLGIIRDPKTNDLRLAPVYDELLFLSCCEMLIRNAIRMTKFMDAFLLILYGTKVNSWRKVALPVIEDAASWLNMQRQKYLGKGDE